MTQREEVHKGNYQFPEFTTILLIGKIDQEEKIKENELGIKSNNSSTYSRFVIKLYI